ncbi:alpha/beta fold hydrolase [Symbioplanes lichenis]|uniref:alpha/beta fold hydrolase n=1 Tax=Symbioplanes lichenis TaxID=1629072 RepID=UPI0027391382|nr:alpha/beta hydrolase [Actinoplanes lichenis]
MSTFRTSDGVSLHHTDDGSGPAVLLIAGFAASADTWELQRRALLAAGHRVLTLDRRGHGFSETPAYGWRMSRHGKDLHDFLTTLDLRDVVLVGGSMGASTIWAYHDLFGGDRVRGIVSVDQTPRMLNDGDWKHGFYGLTPDTIGTFFSGGVPDTGHPGHPSRTAEGLARLVEALGRPPQGSNWRAMRALLQDHASQDWRDVVARVSVPSLFLAGRDSQFWPWTHATAATELNELATAEIVDNCGHPMNLDQADAVNEALVTFLKSLA